MSAASPYAYTMANAHEQSAPEVAHTNYPEVVHNQQYSYNQYPPHTPVKPEDQSHLGGTAYSGSHIDPNSPHPQHAAAAGSGKKSGATICGCSTLVFILFLLIGLLSAAVIGLAAGTGVEAGRANNAETRLAQLSSSLSATSTVGAATATSSSATATATSFADLDNNCSGNPDAVTGTTYDAFSLFGNYSFTMQCNKDAAGTPLLSLFAADFNTCMDHCASYMDYMPKHFGYDLNSTCGGVSFIPLWTTKSDALKGGAPGNCYLKPNSTTSELNDPNIGTECHAALLNAS